MFLAERVFEKCDKSMWHMWNIISAENWDDGVIVLILLFAVVELTCIFKRLIVPHHIFCRQIPLSARYIGRKKMCMADALLLSIQHRFSFVHETKKKTTQKSENHVCRNIFLPPFSLMRKFIILCFVYALTSPRHWFKLGEEVGAAAFLSRCHVDSCGFGYYLLDRLV